MSCLTVKKGLESNGKTINLELIKKYSNKIKSFHTGKKSNKGYELNDRRIFINYILRGLGYSEENLLVDVPQNENFGSRSADIRIYGDNEIKNKNAHSQFVIETKNYQMFKDTEIDYLQLKRYIKFNESKIRIIAVTDYETLYVFNATLIKKSKHINFKNIESLTKFEKKIFLENLLYEIDLINTDNSNGYYKKLSYNKVIAEQKFINPADYEATNSISSPNVRKNFTIVLYNLMIELQKKIFPVFDLIVLKFSASLGIIEAKKNPQKPFNALLGDKEFKPILDYLIWCIEMNYIDDFIFQEKNINFDLIDNLLSDREKKDSFVLTSVYNVINKMMFIRILEDTSTEKTKFIFGKENGRYISNGILERMRKKGNEELAKYIISVFNFEQEDFEPYSFVLKKDIYNWILLFDDDLISDLLIELIRLFNDTNFKRISQDLLGDIYEHYLEQDEDETHQKNYRRLLGQYYTPKPIVRFMWYLTRDIVKKSKNRDLYQENQPFLDIIDPASGSGTFLVEAVLQINESASRKSITKDGRVYSFINNTNNGFISEHVYGFELNPLSKTICDINLFFSLVQMYGMKNISKSEISDLHTYRTDSLDFTEANKKTNDSPNFMLATEIKNSIEKINGLIRAKNKKFDIVIGNPPYGHMAATTDIKKQLIPFAYSENNFNTDKKIKDFSWSDISFNGNVPKNEKNIGKMSDLYAFFFGTANHLVKENGIISFITSNTYLSIPSYKWFRKYLLENYQIEYICNFNPVSSKENSMFYPDAGIATSIIVMQKKIPEANHKIKVLDLSNLSSIKEKYEYFAQVNWPEEVKDPNKTDIKSFLIKPLEQLEFTEIPQSHFLKNIDYTFNLAKNDKEVLMKKLISNSKKLSTIANKNTGVDVGDLKLLVAETKEEIENNIINKVISHDFYGFNKTVINKLNDSLNKGTLPKVFNLDKIKPFVYQKDMSAYHCKTYQYTYHDNAILWRSRLSNDNPPINEKYKLLVKEVRGTNAELVSIVDDKKSLPQHGGRFMYLVENEQLNRDGLYVIAALINSQVGQFIYQFGTQNNKDSYVFDPAKLSSKDFECLSENSKEIHYIYEDIDNLRKNKSKFKSKFFKAHRELNDAVFLAVDDNSMYNLNYTSSMLNSFFIEDVYLSGDKAEININESLSLKLKTKDEELIYKLYNFFKSNHGNSITDLQLNLFTLAGNTDDVIFSAEKEIDIRKEKINNKIFSIYNLDEKQITVVKKSI